MKLPSLANTLATPDADGLLEGDAGLEPPLLPSPLVLCLSCARFRSMSHTQSEESARAALITQNVFVFTLAPK